ncbi:MAG: glycosyltransferase [Gammaproteobacteria bacterium]|jgi:rSAM/selenodomain-associated transferase 2|nr:MAG: glycosyltransferase [Gammaproteobacteria bacterium]
MRISIIIPVLNEAAIVREALLALQPVRAEGHELIVVDGGSEDATCMLAGPLVDRLLTSAPGRARQMNAGAAAARNPLLVFLHIDTRIPFNLQRVLGEIVGDVSAWGRFDVRLSGAHPLLRVIEFMMNLRSRLTGIATGDQAIFCTRDLFLRAGGFPEIALMEDIAISTLLRRLASPLCLQQKVITSSRRWETQGTIRTVLQMWGLRLLYFFGVSPEVLARLYRG